MTPHETMLIEREDGTYKQLEVLDLYDLALLLSYERYTLEPRFRHTVLFDVASGADEFVDSELANLDPLWQNPTKRSKRIGFAFKVDSHDDDARDTPDNMLPRSILLPRVHVLSARQIETIFYQARAHDACYASIALLQFLFALYDDDQPVRIRLGAGTGFLTLLAAHSTAKYILQEPMQMTMSIVLSQERPMLEPRSMAFSAVTYMTGEGDSMPHCVMAFDPITQFCDPDQKSAVLDLASMQFGDSGRGRGALFVLEEMDDFMERMRGIAQSVTGPQMGGPYITNDAERWLEGVARRVKTRYHRRDIEHWCGHCGAPAQRLACRGCKHEWYCNRAHQVAAWPHHKHWCAGRTK
ncbi:hypothetical protein EXIGLDRAFT_736515 [Exidia glandulosa HHB12029]|uniref:MYND-type domain-containing protein n=1 Tax=Exidia glandulosa HHB12029 TaxID=1314781 RepID=A0A165JBU3_EXIGL|nr:hypothetical protein EXIGLDRAFT_736515 [Exidia glandulosa HHB12029]